MFEITFNELEAKVRNTTLDIVRGYKWSLGTKPEMTDDARKKLAGSLKEILKEKTLCKTYTALEGDFRVIFKDKTGNEYRYLLQNDGSLIEKP